MIFIDSKNILQLPTTTKLSTEDISSDARQIDAMGRSMLGLSGFSNQDAILVHNARIQRTMDHVVASKAEQDWNDAARKVYMRKLGIKP